MAFLTSATSGTSPRMRGKPHNKPCCHRLIRNIPAYAGKTLARCRRLRLARGTSPRMRGKHDTLSCWGFSFRNIPAYAGKTTVPATLPPPGWEHPRVCGENGFKGGYRAVGAGNIPAYAGKTSSQRSSLAKSKEHPRVCGENS